MIGQPAFLQKQPGIPRIEWHLKQPVDKSGFAGKSLTDYLLPGELDILVDLIRAHNVKRMVEIGCQNGRTAKVILQNIPDMQAYVGIDVTRDHSNALAYQKNEIPERPGEFAFSDSRFSLLLSRKGTASAFIPLPDDFDCVFIDGDHSFEGVERDYSLARYLVTKGEKRLIIFHDYNDDPRIGVKKFLTLLGQNVMLAHIAKTWLVYTV